MRQNEDNLGEMYRLTQNLKKIQNNKFLSILQKQWIKSIITKKKQDDDNDKK